MGEWGDIISFWEGLEGSVEGRGGGGKGGRGGGGRNKIKHKFVHATLSNLFTPVLEAST